MRALASVGAEVIGIGESPEESLDDELRGWMRHYHQVPSVVNVGAMTDAVRWVQDRAWVDRLESTIEAHILPVAQVREACTIPGTSVRTAYLCRDKPSMKDALRAAGVPTAASTAADNGEQVQQFANEVGFPLILKPRSGAGAADTTRVDDHDQLGQVLASFGDKGVDSIAVEEYVEGHEGFYDTLSVNGAPAADFVCHYFPNVLEAMRTRWISPQYVSTNRVDSVADYQQVREMGQRVIETLGIGTSATHMEWFFGPKGLKFSEIGCRPPGVGAWDLYSAGNDLDLYREWANAIVHGHVSAQPSRRFSSGIVALRPEGDGHISRLLRRARRSRAGTASGSSTPTSRTPVRRPSRTRPATSPTPTSGCGTPTTTCSARCSTTSAGPSPCTPREPPDHAAGSPAACPPAPVASGTSTRTRWWPP